MMKHFPLPCVLFLCFVLGGCALTNRLAVSSMGGIMGQAAQGIEREGNWETLRGSVLANLSLIEGLLAVSPHNEDLLLQASKANSAYAFGVLETLGIEDSRHLQQALRYYAKAIHWGMSYLRQQGVSRAQLISAQREGKLGALLDRRLGSDQGIEAIFFLAQSMGAYGNLLRTSPMVMAQLPLVKGLFDWVCGVSPDIRQGACGIFYGAWELGRPWILGGDRNKGVQHFQRAIKKYPQNYLIRVAYLRFYVIPYGDSKVRREQVAFLRESFKVWEKRFSWPPTRVEGYQDGNNLTNAIAKKQFELLMKGPLK